MVVLEVGVGLLLVPVLVAVRVLDPLFGFDAGLVVRVDP